MFFFFFSSIFPHFLLTTEGGTQWENYTAQEPVLLLSCGHFYYVHSSTAMSSLLWSFPLNSLTFLSICWFSQFFQPPPLSLTLIPSRPSIGWRTFFLFAINLVMNVFGLHSFLFLGIVHNFNNFDVNLKIYDTLFWNDGWPVQAKYLSPPAFHYLCLHFRANLFFSYLSPWSSQTYQALKIHFYDFSLEI